MIGPGELDGLVWATGHWRNGVLLAPLTGDVVAGLLAGRAALPEDWSAALSAERFASRGAAHDRGDAQRRAARAARERRPSRPPCAVAGAGAGGRGVAVALDGEVVPRGEWATTELRDGQQLEVLHAVQGGA